MPDEVQAGWVRMEYVDFGLKSVRDSIEYLATAGLIAPERVGEIVSGTLV